MVAASVEFQPARSNGPVRRGAYRQSPTGDAGAAGGIVPVGLVYRFLCRHLGGVRLLCGDGIGRSPSAPGWHWQDRQLRFNFRQRLFLDHQFFGVGARHDVSAQRQRPDRRLCQRATVLPKSVGGCGLLWRAVVRRICSVQSQPASCRKIAADLLTPQRAPWATG